MSENTQFSISRKGLAWLIHLYTAFGGVAGLFALIYASQNKFAEASLLLLLQMIIDATDGLLARKIRIWEVLPGFDGAEMDNVIDIFTYAWIPIFIIYKLNVLPSNWLLLIPTFASLYAYGQTNMKSEDAFFIGFPTYWNVIAMYLYFLHPGYLVSSLIIIIPGILSFIPTRYLYPSKNNIFWKTSWLLGAIWFFMASYLLIVKDLNKPLVCISLFFPVYYMIVSFYVDYKLRKTIKQ